MSRENVEDENSANFRVLFLISSLYFCYFEYRVFFSVLSFTPSPYRLMTDTDERSCVLRAFCPRFFTARCYASAVLAMGLCLSVCLCLSVRLCLSQVGVLLKRQNVGSYKQHHTIVQRLWFSDAKDLREIRPGSPPTRAPNAGWVVKIGDFRQITGYISKTVKVRHNSFY